MKIQVLMLLFFTFVLTSNSFSRNNNIPTLITSKNNLIEAQYQKSIALLFNNLSPKDGLKGAVIAAPSKSHPDYYYNWVRDAALTVDSMISLYLATPTNKSSLRSAIKRFFLDFINFNIHIQKTSQGFAGLGEPKFLVDGSPFTGPWGRPQNDGPALRSIVVMQILSLAAQEKWPEYKGLLEKLYVPSLGTTSLIKSDLEYVAHQWMHSNFDLWEEVGGHHFYTLMSQRKSLYLGAHMANFMKDIGAVKYYQQEMKKINARLESFWNPNLNFILATFYANQAPFYTTPSRLRSKSHLDTAVILGVLHSEVDHLSYSVNDPRVFATYLTLKKSFAPIYSVNKEASLNTSFGRYPEDTYDGYQTNSRGNPWVLTTAAAAEFLYRLSLDYLKTQKIVINFANVEYFSQVLKVQLKAGQVLKFNQAEYNAILNHLVSEGDTYMLRILYHGHPDGSLSEQFNRDNGYMQGAPNLTWSHASFITAKIKRDQLLSYFRTR